MKMAGRATGKGKKYAAGEKNEIRGRSQFGFPRRRGVLVGSYEGGEAKCQQEAKAGCARQKTSDWEKKCRTGRSTKSRAARYMDNSEPGLYQSRPGGKANVTPGRRLDIEGVDTTPPKRRSDTAQLATVGDEKERQVEHQWMMVQSWPSRTLGEAKDWTMMSHPTVHRLLPRLSRRFHRGLDGLAHPPSRTRGKLRQGLSEVSLILRFFAPSS
ncbi:hypothetical protein ASPCAL07316 [Aspergillus calidoustus]|uniref:Uncharacterized protein n=1 Tax=Aspergillus calidoustus TaxID=454130 RepID=A0A0U5G2V2_ASPCI|nr:hypothetical protein ASPCAL07316 [Aspergillus calidoustus]